jgi:hypothetical protein
MAENLSKVAPPALPLVAPEYQKSTFDQLSNALRLYFNRMSTAFNTLVGRHGARFLDVPNGLFWDNADQALADVNVAQPVRFNQTYLDSGMSINGLTTSEITVDYNGVYNFQFTGQVRSGSAASKIIFVWLRRNDVDVGYSAREYILSGSGGIIEIAWSFNIDLLTGQYIQIMWAGNDIDLSLDAVAPTSPHPGIPSAVVAVSFVSALPEVLPTLP